MHTQVGEREKLNKKIKPLLNYSNQKHQHSKEHLQVFTDSYGSVAQLRQTLRVHN